MSDLIERCEAGCMAFDGGERTHHVDCVFYPESLTKMHAEALAAKDKRIAELEAALQSIASNTQTTDMLWWQNTARQALAQEEGGNEQPKYGI